MAEQLIALLYNSDKQIDAVTWIDQIIFKVYIARIKTC
jgi:hypothetical protein